MPRAARPWFRFYVEAMRDPKMRRLTPAQRWLWVAVLAAARESCLAGFLFIAEGVPMSWDDLADYAGMKLREVEQGIERMRELGMLVHDDHVGAWHVPAWNDRQYESDNTTERTRKHRSNERGRNVPTTPEGTPPETEADTDTEINSTVELELDVQDVPAADPVEVVWEAWLESTGKLKSVLDPKRRRVIVWALDHYAQDDVVDAVRGWTHSSHHRGENDRRTIYNDITLLLRDAKQIEFFRDLQRDAQSSAWSPALGDEPPSGPSLVRLPPSEQRGPSFAKPAPCPIGVCDGSGNVYVEDEKAARRCAHVGGPITQRPAEAVSA